MKPLDHTRFNDKVFLEAYTVYEDFIKLKVSKHFGYSIGSFNDGGNLIATWDWFSYPTSLRRKIPTFSEVYNRKPRL